MCHGGSWRISSSISVYGQGERSPSSSLDVLNSRKGCPCDVLDGFHHPLQCLAVSNWAVPTPDYNTIQSSVFAKSFFFCCFYLLYFLLFYYFSVYLLFIILHYYYYYCSISLCVEMHFLFVLHYFYYCIYLSIHICIISFFHSFFECLQKVFKGLFFHFILHYFYYIAVMFFSIWHFLLLQSSVFAEGLFIFMWHFFNYCRFLVSAASSCKCFGNKRFTT